MAKKTRPNLLIIELPGNEEWKGDYYCEATGVRLTMNRICRLMYAKSIAQLVANISVISYHPDGYKVTVKPKKRKKACVRTR